MLDNPHCDLRHWPFVTECLADLNQQLRTLGQATDIAALPPQVVMAQHEVVELLAELAGIYELRGLYAYKETGLALTYRHDEAVAAWCRAHSVGWHQAATAPFESCATAAPGSPATVL